MFRFLLVLALIAAAVILALDTLEADDRHSASAPQPRTPGRENAPDPPGEGGEFAKPVEVRVGI